MKKIGGKLQGAHRRTGKTRKKKGRGGKEKKGSKATRELEGGCLGADRKRNEENV